jgi:DNA-binding Xre family transcriptional regulator
MILCNLAVLMAERKLSIQDIADKTKLSRTTISALVNEIGKGIQFETMDVLCEFLKVTPGELFTFVSLKTQFIVDEVDNISLDENLKDNHLLAVTRISCNLRISGYVKIGSSIFEEQFTLQVFYSLNNDLEIVNLSYHLMKPNNFLPFISNIQYTVMNHVLNNLEYCILDAGIENFNQIKGVFPILSRDRPI